MSAGSVLLPKRAETINSIYGTENVFSSSWFIQNISLNEDFWVEKYGSSREEVYRKRTQTVWKTYTPEQKQERCRSAYTKAKENCLANRGISLSQFRSLTNKAAWSKLSPEQRQNRITRSTTSRGNISALEIAVLDIAATMWQIDRQKWLHFGSVNRRYDAHIIGTDILIEINGDYWHANPAFYKPGDVLKHPGGVKRVDDIWERDREKSIVADLCGYRVIQIWECEIKQSRDIRQLLQEKTGL